MMEKQILERVKKTLIILLLVSVVVSLTAASVSAWECPMKEKAPPEKGVCMKSMEEKAPPEKGVCMKSMKEKAPIEAKKRCQEKRYGSALCKCDCGDGMCCAGACTYVPFLGYKCLDPAGLGVTCVPNVGGKLC